MCNGGACIEGIVAYFGDGVSSTFVQHCAGNDECVGRFCEVAPVWIGVTGFRCYYGYGVRVAVDVVVQRLPTGCYGGEVVGQRAQWQGGQEEGENE